LYSRFQISIKYLQYYLTAYSGKGHGIHSPFVFDFIDRVLNDRKNYEVYEKIEALRSTLLKNDDLIFVQDFGAGSYAGKSKALRIGDLVRRSVKSRKMAQLLYRVLSYYKPGTILELGTSVGLTTSYLAAADPSSKCITVEGSQAVALLAKRHFQVLGVHQVDLLTGSFEDNLDRAFDRAGSFGFVFIDGNHRLAPTLNYFERLRGKMEPFSILVLDDIHWSKEMEEAWTKIKNHPDVWLTIDLFFMGMVFFSDSFRVKQHFSIRF
jgi:predicted O-methyltransferase YrrM